MAFHSTSALGTLVVISAENWAEMISFVMKMGEEVEQFRLDLTTGAARSFSDKPKLNKPARFSGRFGTINTWACHMDTNVPNPTTDEALIMATSCLQGNAISWWQAYAEESDVTDWPTLRAAPRLRFNHLNRVQTARGHLQTWKQMKDVKSYNESFQSIILDIPDMSMAEKIDRHVRGLKSYIWEALCLKHYDTLDDVMRDAVSMEAAKHGVCRVLNTEGAAAAMNGPIPMDITEIQIVKLTPEERKR
eukprot:contig_17377_g4241